jgi:hypothetical protein
MPQTWRIDLTMQDFIHCLKRRGLGSAMAHVMLHRSAQVPEGLATARKFRLQNLAPKSAI